MLKVDLHIHTINSGHAFGTFYDVIREAGEKKMELIAVTDHGPSMEGTMGKVHFYMGSRAPAQNGNLRVLWGCESNLINEQGDIDLEQDLQEKLDFLIMGIHPFTPYTDQGKKKNTIALKKAIKKNPKIKFLSHPTFYPCEYNWHEVWEYAFEYNVLLELNISSLLKYGHSKTTHFTDMIEFTKKHSQKLIVNSDAHFLHEIGDDTLLKKYWNELGLSDDLIINNDINSVYKWLEINRNT